MVTTRCSSPFASVGHQNYTKAPASAASPRNFCLFARCEVLLGGGSRPPSCKSQLLGGGSGPPSSKSQLLGGGKSMSSELHAPPPGSDVRPPLMVRWSTRTPTGGQRSRCMFVRPMRARSAGPAAQLRATAHPHECWLWHGHSSVYRLYMHLNTFVYQQPRDSLASCVQG